MNVEDKVRASAQIRRRGRLARSATLDARCGSAIPSLAESPRAQKFRAQLPRSGGLERESLLERDSRRVRQGLGRPWGEACNDASLGVGVSKALVEPAMLRFPISRADINRLAGIESFRRQHLQFLVSVLLGLNQPLQVGFDRDPFCRCQRTKLALKFGMDRDAHSS